jgi:hypothetical protein
MKNTVLHLVLWQPDEFLILIDVLSLLIQACSEDGGNLHPKAEMSSLVPTLDAHHPNRRPSLSYASNAASDRHPLTSSLSRRGWCLHLRIPLVGARLAYRILRVHTTVHPIPLTLAVLFLPLLATRTFMHTKKVIHDSCLETIKESKSITSQVLSFTLYH